MSVNYVNIGSDYYLHRWWLYCQFGHWEQTSIKFWSKYISVHWNKYIWKCRLQISVYLLSGEPDYFGRNKISSGGDLSHYSSASLY